MTEEGEAPSMSIRAVSRDESCAAPAKSGVASNGGQGAARGKGAWGKM